MTYVIQMSRAEPQIMITAMTSAGFGLSGLVVNGDQAIHIVVKMAEMRNRPLPGKAEG